MPKVNRDSYFEGGQFLKAPDVKDGQSFMIEKFEEIKTRIGTRPCLRLKGVDKPFGLNATNLDWLIEKWGDESDDWLGKRIKFRKVKAPNPQLGGKEVDSLRLT